MKRIASVLVIAVTGVLLAPPPAAAQVGYFGQNKVQYRSFDFKVLKTDHFDIYYYPEEEQAARMAARMAERWYARLSTVFDHALRNRQVVVLYASGAQFRQTNVVEGDLGEGTGGVTEAYKRRIVLPLAGPLKATDHVLGHELVHAFQYDVTNTNASAVAAGSAGIESLPLWFIEGMAEYLSLGPDDPNTAMWMRDAVRRDDFPTIDKLDNPKYFPYRYGQALWAYIGGRYGDATVGKLLRSGAGSNGYKVAFQRVLGKTPKELATEWHDATVAAYRPVAEATRAAKAFGRPLVVGDPKSGELNVSPELSPDGTKVVFFSSRDLFSIDLYVADAATGKILRKLTDTATNPHLESIEFIESAGAWSRDSRRFAFPALSGGSPVVRIVDTETGDKERDVELKTLDEVLTPTWSPDGGRIAFTAIVGGLSDLFIYDLNANSLRRITHDAYAELQPSWSPDGNTILISTDRFSTNLETLATGRLRLAAVDVSSGDIREVGGFSDAKNINPQWSPDGGSIYFISDREGISNVYRMPAGGGTPLQVTNIVTGVSGITDMSPALSVGQSRASFSVYENNGYNIYALDEGAIAGREVGSNLPHDAGILPPRTVSGGGVASYLQDEVAGLPPASAQAAYPTEPYHPKLHLDFLGQPMVGVGADSFGTYVGGGVSAMFSDTLGNHVVAGGVNLSSRFDEAGGSVVYLNRSHRWNWGAAVDQTPYVLRGFSQGLTGTAEQPLVEEDETRILQIDRGFSGLATYPVNRAQRIEFSGGLRQITGKTDVTTRLFDYFFGPAAVPGQADDQSVPDAQSRDGFVGARLRHLDFRGHESDSRIALSARVRSDGGQSQRTRPPWPTIGPT